MPQKLLNQKSSLNHLAILYFFTSSSIVIRLQVGTLIPCLILLKIFFKIIFWKVDFFKICSKKWNSFSSMHCNIFFYFCVVSFYWQDISFFSFKSEQAFCHCSLFFHAESVFFSFKFFLLVLASLSNSEMHVQVVGSRRLREYVQDVEKTRV